MYHCDTFVSQNSNHTMQKLNTTTFITFKREEKKRKCKEPNCLPQLCRQHSSTLPYTVKKYFHDLLSQHIFFCQINFIIIYLVEMIKLIVLTHFPLPSSINLKF